MMTAADLELYSMPGAGSAAREISKAVTAAKRQMFRECPSGTEQPEVVRAYIRATASVRPVLQKHANFGACDTEPVYHVRQALVVALANHLKLDANATRALIADLA